MSEEKFAPQVAQEALVREHFVDRDKELELFRDLLKSRKDKQILSIVGGPGMGKTWLLARLVQDHGENPRLAMTKEPIDFYLTTYRSEDGVRRGIAQQLGWAHFTAYGMTLNDLEKGRQAELSEETLANLARKAQDAFVSDYNSLAEKNDKIVLLLDTYELVQNEPISMWLTTTLLPHINKTVVVLAGRRNQEIDFGPMRDAVETVSLGPLPVDAAKEYLAKKGLEDIADEVIGQIWQLAEGRPLLIDMAMDWIKENIDIEQIINVPRRKFQEQLVATIRDLRKPKDQAILYMAWAHRRFDAELLRFLMDDPSIDYDRLVDELGQLSFVKYRPRVKSILLHDEMREMVTLYVWNRIDPDGIERQALSGKILTYYDRLITHEISEDERRNLEAEKVFYTMHLELGRGYERFAEVFDALYDQERYDDCEVLLSIIQPFEAEAVLEQKHTFGLRRSRWFLRKNRFSELRQTLEPMLAQHPDDEHKIDMYLVLSDCAVREGHYGSAEESLNNALQLCEWIPGNPKRGRVKSELGYVNRLRGNWARAIAWYTESVPELLADEKELANVYNTIGYIYALGTDYETALQYCENARAMREKMGNVRGLAFSWSTLGEINRYKAQYQKALDCYAKALSMFERNDVREGMALVWQEQATAKLETDRLEEAEDDLLRSIEFYETSGNVRDLPRALNRLGRLHHKKGNLIEAQDRFRRSWDLARRLPDVDVAVYSLVWLARIACELEKSFQEIRRDFADELERLIAEHDYQNPQHPGQMKVTLGHVLFREGQIDSALEHYAEGLSLIAGQRRGEYLVTDNLSILGEHIDILPPSQAITWCDVLRAKWEQIAGLPENHPEMLHFCVIHQERAKVRQIMAAKAQE
jgi:tetratricopeptide (TPR) repeat protein